MKIFQTCSILIIGLFFFLTSCQNDIKSFEDVDESEVEAINAQSDSASFGPKFSSKGATWKAWDKYFKTCLKNPNLQKLQFAGYSNTIKIGDIRTLDGLSSYSLFSILTPEEYESWVKIGNESNGCKSRREVEQEISNTIAASFLKIGNANLKIASNLIDSTEVQIGTFSVEEISNIDAFRKFVNSEDRLKDYKESLFNKKRRLIVQAVKVSNAKLFVSLNTDFSAGLSAQVDSALTEKIKIADGQIDLKFTRVNNRTFSCDIQNEFYVFMRTKKIK